MKHKMAFVTTVTDAVDLHAVRRLISSIRAFAGEFSQETILVFTSLDGLDLSSEDVKVIQAISPRSIADYPLGEKVVYCSMAEQELRGTFETMVYVDPYSLVLRPPCSFQLDAISDVALRPVHIKNIGQPADEPLSEFWSALYKLVGITMPNFKVVSFVDSCSLYPYFNTHCFSIKPDLGLCERWMQLLSTSILNDSFQDRLCPDFQHKLFLHQAIFSSLVTAEISQERIRILPPDYSYPYHLQQEIPPSLKASVLNDLTHVVYENCSINPDKIAGIAIHEPLNTWFRQHWLDENSISK